MICKGNESQIKQLARHLYSIVGVAGQAYCDIDTLKICDFTIDEILPYEDTPITDAFRALAEAGASYFDHVDVDAYVREMRSDIWEE